MFNTVFREHTPSTRMLYAAYIGTRLISLSNDLKSENFKIALKHYLDCSRFTHVEMDETKTRKISPSLFRPLLNHSQLH